jgi:RDD family/Protein of unknown function (DUF2510)
MVSTGNPPAGYYADPSVPGYIRYWDGNEWVAGSSRPAPEEPAPSPTQTPMPAPMPFAQPAPTPPPTPAPMPFTQPASSATDEIPKFVVPDEEPNAPATTVVELATPGSRILARIVDLGLAAIFSAPITVTLLLIAHQHDHRYVLKLDAKATTTYTTLGMDGPGIALWAAALLALMIVSILYEGNRLGRGGQTIGRKIAGVRVVRMPEGLPLGRNGIGTRRALLYWILAILPLLDILTLGGVFWGRPYRQGLHEKLTSTATVKA